MSHPAASRRPRPRFPGKPSLRMSTPGLRNRHGRHSGPVFGRCRIRFFWLRLFFWNRSVFIRGGRPSPEYDPDSTGPENPPLHNRKAVARDFVFRSRAENGSRKLYFYASGMQTTHSRPLIYFIHLSHSLLTYPHTIEIAVITKPGPLHHYRFTGILLPATDYTHTHNTFNF